MSRGKILFNLSGSIACFKAAQAISDLVKLGFEVQTVATRGALEFIGEATLEGLTGRRVFSDIFAKGQMMDHIHWARWADLSLLCPATAVTLNGLAAGSAESVVGTLFMAHDLKRGTYWIAPAMNSMMLEHPATQASIEELQSWGVRILAGREGSLACGEWGAGRMIEPAELIQEILGYFERRATPPATRAPAVRVVITAGGTREYLDPVRCLSNASTGATGRAIAEALLRHGHEVRYFHGEGTQTPEVRDRLTLHPFVSARDLEHALLTHLRAQNVDVVIHSAAVSDYTLSTRFATKLDSGRPLRLDLVPAPKIVQQIRKASRNPNTRLIAFKLTHETPREERLSRARALIDQSSADLVIANDRTEISGTRHPALGVSAAGIDFETHTKQDLAQRLCEWIENPSQEPAP